MPRTVVVTLLVFGAAFAGANAQEQPAVPPSAAQSICLMME
jgi:hypothetical protein